MSFNMFSNVSTEGGSNGNREFKPLPEGSYIVQFTESSRKNWDGIPQISFRFNTPYLIEDEDKFQIKPINKVVGRDEFNLFTSFRIFKPVEFDDIEIGFHHNERPLRALMMATKALTAYETDEEVQEVLQIPVVPSYHTQSNGITNADDIVDSYMNLFNNILIGTACKADVTKFNAKSGKVYNNIKWYRALSEAEVDKIESGGNTQVDDERMAVQDSSPVEQTPRVQPPARSNPQTLSDDDIPF